VVRLLLILQVVILVWHQDLIRSLHKMLVAVLRLMRILLSQQFQVLLQLQHLRKLIQPAL